MAERFDGIFFDNDVLSRIAAAGMVEHVLAVVGIGAERAYCLPSLVPMLGEKKRIGRSMTPEAREAALRGIAGVRVWRDSPDATLRGRLAAVPGIDDGEAVIFAALVEDRTLALATGDKVSLRALCAAPELRDVRDALAGRVLCLETLLHGLVMRHGALAVGEAFRLVRRYQTIGIVLSDVAMRDEMSCAARA